MSLDKGSARASNTERRATGARLQSLIRQPVERTRISYHDAL